MLRLLYAIPTWILMFIINTITIIAGWIVVPIAAACKAYEAYDWHDGAGTPRVQYRWTWRWMWLWGNSEDGIANDSYKKIDSMFMKIIYWSCVRNPSNNLRMTPYVSFIIDPSKVGFIGSDPVNTSYANKPPRVEWFFAWHGIYSSFWIIFNYKGTLKRFWIGWKVYPNDQKGLSPGSYRNHGVGYCTQFKDA